jgi:hypothetical protein
VIILSGVLVVLAIALLVTGIVTGNTGHEVLGLDGLKLIYISIGVSIVSALCLAIGVFIRRKDLFGTATSAKPPARARKARSKPVRAKAKAKVGVPAATVPAAPAPRVPAETTVFIVPGRKRYHLESCRQLAGHDREELTFSEARDEGFTACTACLPDTALAARAAHTDIVPPDARPEPEAAEVTRTDLPVTLDEPAGETGRADDTVTESRRTRSFFEPLDHDGAEEPPGTDEAERSGRKSAADDAVSSVRIISGTKRYHRRDCALIEDIADDTGEMQTLPLAEAQDGGYTPCLVCQPDQRLGG